MLESGRSGRLIAALGVSTLLLATGITACGGDDGAATPESVPAEAIAVVAETPITKDAFERRLTARTRGVSPLTGVSAIGVTLDSPRFRVCIGELRRQITNSGALSRAQLLENCRLQYQREKDATVSELIEEQWFIQQAEADGIDLSEAEIDERLDQYEASLGATPGQAKRLYQSLLRRSGMTRDDLRVQLRGQIAKQAVLASGSEAEKPGEEEVRAFFEDNPDLFGKPADRTIEVLVTESEDAANAAVARIEAGEAVSQVSVEVSDDPAIRSQDGILKLEQGVEDPTAPAELAEVVFDAPEDEVVGPVEVDGRWFVFRVVTETAADLPSFEAVEKRASRLAAAAAVESAASGLQSDLEEAWRGRTLCAEDYLVAQCSNAA